MKRFIHILLLATIFLLSLSLSAQNKGFQLPNKKQSTTKSSANKSSNSPKSNKQNSHSSNQAKRSPKIPEVIQRLIQNMVYVEGGTFTMGPSTEQGSDALENEKPAHNVTLSSFFIGKYEITQAEWQAVMGNNPSYHKGSSLPVESVSWNDCQEFISKLNTMTGQHFRLPTEAEWEFAARGGNRSRRYKYAGSNTPSTVAWYYENSGSMTHTVGIKTPNELGLYDMSGNVLEWCQDRFGSYSNDSLSNSSGPSSDSYRVYRGGSWFDNGRGCRLSYRGFNSPSSKYGSLGLRLAL